MGAVADTVVIGAGLSGLVDAILLAESGRKVLVIEQHTVPGGYLQQFQRKNTRFDVGFHWIGSTRPGRPMHALLGHLQVRDRLRWLPFPADAAIEVRGPRQRFALPTTWERFAEKAAAMWPGQREALARFVEEVDEVGGRFKWFHLRRNREDKNPLSSKTSLHSMAETIAAQGIDDPWLVEVLGSQAMNLGLLPGEIPWTKYALALRANFDDTSRIEGGGGALVKALLERGRELGVVYRFRDGLVSMECEAKRVRAVTTNSGDRLEADLFVAACPPKAVLRLLPDEPLYKQRVLGLRDSRGALQVFVRLGRPLRSLDRTCLLLTGDPPLLVTYPDETRLEAMGYVDAAPFRRWRDRPVMRRGADYGRLKRSLADDLVARIAKVAPELPGAIEDLYVATPLSDEFYTRNDGGGVFGISHDLTQQGLDRPMPRMRLRNLFFTGHSIDMPGIAGVVINAFSTCAAIRGDNWLFDQVAR